MFSKSNVIKKLVRLTNPQKEYQFYRFSILFFACPKFVFSKAGDTTTSSSSPSSSSGRTSFGSSSSYRSNSNSHWVFWYYGSNQENRQCGNLCLLTFILLAFIILCIISWGIYRCCALRKSSKEDETAQHTAHNIGGNWSSSHLNDSENISNLYGVAPQQNIYSSPPSNNEGYSRPSLDQNPHSQIYSTIPSSEHEQLFPPPSPAHLSYLSTSQGTLAPLYQRPISTQRPYGDSTEAPPAYIPPDIPLDIPSPAHLHHPEEQSPPFTQNLNLPPEVHQEHILSLGGARAWKFTKDLKPANGQHSPVTIEPRVIVFHPAKGVNITVQTNYPLFVPTKAKMVNLIDTNNLLHYFEINVLTNPTPTKTTIAIGLSSKPYPSNSLVGWHPHSVSYHSDNGHKLHNSHSGGELYGPTFGKVGDIIGCGYYPYTGSIFFTLNGSSLGIAYTNLKQTWFPSIGADGPCKIAINFGDSEEEAFRYELARGFGPGAPVQASPIDSQANQKFDIAFLPSDSSLSQDSLLENNPLNQKEIGETLSEFYNIVANLGIPEQYSIEQVSSNSNEASPIPRNQALITPDINFDHFVSSINDMEVEPTILEAALSDNLFVKAKKNTTKKANDNGLKPLNADQANTYEEFAQIAKDTYCTRISVAERGTGDIFVRMTFSNMGILYSFSGNENYLDYYLEEPHADFTRYPKISDAQVHTGFYETFLNWQKELLSNLVDVISQIPGVIIRFIGYGTGGVFAQLAALALRRSLPTVEINVYTFGQPRFCNAALAAAAEKSARVLRFTVGHDPIPRLPVKYQSEYYVHAGTEIYMNKAGTRATVTSCPINKSSGQLSTESEQCINKDKVEVKYDHIGPYFDNQTFITPDINFDNFISSINDMKVESEHYPLQPTNLSRLSHTTTNKYTNLFVKAKKNTTKKANDNGLKPLNTDQANTLKEFAQIAKDIYCTRILEAERGTAFKGG
ncbi:hypothetical protein G9A89_010198 [Geosiphon pyriformis]|nr:hypothetical protein G9A89_010198 [Geosiphon pyriformis]